MKLTDHFTRHAETHHATELDPEAFAPRANWWPLAGIGGVLVLGAAAWAVFLHLVGVI